MTTQTARLLEALELIAAQGRSDRPCLYYSTTPNYPSVTTLFPADLREAIADIRKTFALLQVADEASHKQ